VIGTTAGPSDGASTFKTSMGEARRSGVRAPFAIEQGSADQADRPEDASDMCRLALRAESSGQQSYGCRLRRGGARRFKSECLIEHDQDKRPQAQRHHAEDGRMRRGTPWVAALAAP